MLRFARPCRGACGWAREGAQSRSPKEALIADNTRERLEFLVLGHSPHGATGWPHPVTISVHPRGDRTLIDFSVGAGMLNAGGQRGVMMVMRDGELDEKHAEEFDACDARWLVPDLARLEAGEQVDEHELVQAYESKHGRAPKRECSADYTY